MAKVSPIRVVKQRHNWDCGVACLAMILDKEYGDVIRVTKDLYPTIPRRGLGLYHLEAIAVEFHQKFRRVYKRLGYLERNPTGILGVMGGHIASEGHWVVLKEGVVIEPWHVKRSIYGLQEYLHMNKARTATILVLEDK